MVINVSNKRSFDCIFIVIVIVIVCALSMCSCSSARHFEVATCVQHDTVYLSNVQYDSIYIYKDRLTDRSKDTVYLKDISVEYRYTLLRDTIKVIQRDSIPYEVTITEIRELPRPLSFFDHLTRATFWLLCGVLSAFAIKVIAKSFIF